MSRIIELKEMINSMKSTYALFTTDKDVNIIFINYERFQNESKLYKVIDKFNYDYKVYLNKKNEIQFATWNGLTLDITEQNFSNFDIIKEFFMKNKNMENKADKDIKENNLIYSDDKKDIFKLPLKNWTELKKYRSQTHYTEEGVSYYSYEKKFDMNNCKILKYVANHCKNDIEQLMFEDVEYDDLFEFYQDFIVDKISADLKKENKILCKIEDIDITEFNNMLKYRATVLYK